MRYVSHQEVCLYGTAAACRTPWSLIRPIAGLGSSNATYHTAHTLALVHSSTAILTFLDGEWFAAWELMCQYAQSLWVDNAHLQELLSAGSFRRTWLGMPEALQNTWSNTSTVFCISIECHSLDKYNRYCKKILSLFNCNHRSCMRYRIVIIHVAVMVGQTI